MLLLKRLYKETWTQHLSVKAGDRAMVDQTYEQEILDHVRKLSADKQRRVLEFVKGLEKLPGIPGWLAIQYADEIDFPLEDLAEIKEALKDFKKFE
jgi:hypothetical protein